MLPAAAAAASVADTRSAEDPLALWRMDLVREVLRRSADDPRGRASSVAAAAATVWPTGPCAGQTLKASTLAQWVRKYEARGLCALARKQRGDKAARRTFITRAIDAELRQCNASDAEVKKAAAAVQRHVASQWRSGASSWPNVQQLAIPFVVRLLRKAGSTRTNNELVTLCTLPRRLIESSRHYSEAALYRKDAGRSAATQISRIERDASSLRPMEYVSGDVHHIDVLVEREDGTVATPKMIAWLCKATNRIRYNLYLCDKGRNIRQEDVKASFCEMAADPNWGIPTYLYLDNGSEYRPFGDDFIRDLSRLKRRIIVQDEQARKPGVINSLPYNAQGKAIEGTFANIEKVLSMLPAHIGGNRMKSKTANQGKPPAPYPGGFAAFERDFRAAIEYIHGKPQSGRHMAGRSPNEVFAAFVADGWQSVTIDATELAIAFVKPQEARIDRSTFKWNKTRFYDDELRSLPQGSRILVRQSPFDRDRAVVFSTDDKFLCIAAPAPVYGYPDIEGAKEWGRRKKVLHASIVAKEAETDLLDPLVAMRELADLRGRGPDAQIAAVISVNGELQKAAAAHQFPAPLSPSEYERKQLQEYAEFEKLTKSIRKSR